MSVLGHGLISLGLGLASHGLDLGFSRQGFVFACMRFTFMF